MKIRKILNALMILSIVLVVLCGIMAVRSIKGPAVKPGTAGEQAETARAEAENAEAQAKEKQVLLVRNKSGIVTVERSGIAYEVEDNSDIRTGDIFHTKTGAAVSLANAENRGFSLGADTELEITDAGSRSEEDNRKLAATLHGGELFVDLRGIEKEVGLTAGQAELASEQAVFTITAQSAAYTVYVYAGEVSISGEVAADVKTAKAGQVLSLVQNKEETLEAEVAAFAPEALSDTQLTLLKNCKPDDSFCVTAREITDVQEARLAEKEQAEQELLLLAEQTKAKLAQEQAAYEQAEEQYVKEYAKAMESLGVEVKTDEKGNVIVENPKYCTISIRCDTILNNMGDLTVGKEGFVPGSGSILSTKKVMFTQGDTVFDVLQRACAMSGVQLEYSWTPIYDSYYIEGINNLYEFDCGSQSGWMYKVNGWFPNYGCSKYVVNEGDTIVWCYTCKGLGADVGGRVNH